MGFLVFSFTYLKSDFHSLFYVQNKSDLSSCSLKSSSDITWAFLQDASALSTLFTMISHLDVICLLWYYQTTEVFNAHILFLVSFFFLLSGDLLISSLVFSSLFFNTYLRFFPIVKRLLWQIWPILDFPSCKSYLFYNVILSCDIIYNIFTSLFCCFTCSMSYGTLTWEYQCSAYVYRISWSKVSLSWFYNWIERNFYLIHVVSSSYSEKPLWEGKGDPLQ